MRVLHVVESWRPRLAGYTTRGWALVEAQARLGIAEPSVLVTSRQHTYGVGRVEAPEGARAVLAAPSARERWVRRVRPFYLDPAALRRAIRAAAVELRSEAVHVHWGSGIGWAAAEAAADLGVPLVAEVRFDLAGAVMSETVRLPLPPLERLLRRRFERHLPRAAAVVAASHTLGALVAETFPELADRLFVVPNGVDVGSFRPPSEAARARVRERLGLGGRFVVGSTSNMLRYEGLDLLVEAAAGLGRDLHLLFVGDGTQRAALEAQAQRLGVPATFTGRVPFAEVPGYLGAMDAYAIPRRPATVTRYAAPIKAVEAMAAGLPVVGSAVGDLPQLFAAGRGRMVPPGDVHALAEALDDLARPEARQAMGREARSWVERSATWEDAVAPYRAAYDRAVPGARPEVRRDTRRPAPVQHV